MTNKFTSSRSSESYWNLIFIAFTICYNLILLFFLMILTANDYCENENKNDFNKRRLSLILAWKIFDKESWSGDAASWPQTWQRNAIL